jgi:hypothetical protein
MQRQWRWWRCKCWCLGIVDRPSLACSRNDSGSGSADDGALALLAVSCLLAQQDDDDGGNGMNDSALASFTIPACLLDNNNGSGGSVDDGAFALSAVPYLLTQ